MSTPIEISGALLRHRFRVTLNSGLEAPGFVYDRARLPGLEIDNGSAVGTGSFWDGNNAAFEDRFDIPEISGRLFYSSNRSNIIRGLPFLVAGHGDNDDLELSGIDINPSGTSWSPVIEPGIFFDLDTPCYLYSDEAIELVIFGSGVGLFAATMTPPTPYKPVSLATYHVDVWGRVRPYELFRQKHSFTSINDEETLGLTEGSEPPLYEPLYDNVIWDNVDTSGFEFFVDANLSGFVRNRDIVDTVDVKLHRVPWSQEYFQLPLVPAIEFTGPWGFYVKADPVRITNTSGYVTLAGVGSLVVKRITTSGYTRISGSWDELSGVLPVASTSGFATSGYLLLDDDDFRQEVISYASKTSTSFSGIVRGQQFTTAVIHRDGAQVRQTTLSGQMTSQGVLSHLANGDYLIDYRMDTAIYDGFDEKTGLLHISIASGLERCYLEARYTRGLLLCYEPSGSAEYLRRPTETDLNPLSHGVDHGIVWASMFPLRPAQIKLTTSRSKNSDGTIGPVYAGNDFLVVNAQVLNHQGAPIPNEEVTLVLENPVNAGFVNAEDPSLEFITRVTDGTGTARFVYTPPDTIQGLGYFAPSGNLVGSGLVLVEQIPIEEVWNDTDGYKTLLFGVSDEDSYTPYSEVSGAFDLTADGRFELVTELSGTADDNYTIWKALEPIALLDENGLVITTSGSRVAQIVFPPASVPEARAYFVSVERRVSVGAMIPSANVASESVEVVVGIPRFMTGEFLFGPVDDPETSAFDSLAYLTINPFERRNPTDARQDPRTLGHMFRVRGSVQNQIRHKFYVGISYAALENATGGRNEIRKIHALRHRFIIEV